MKLYLMKKDALELVKNNLSVLYGKYYSEKSNKWIYEVYGNNPFVEYKEIPDFSLANLESDLSKGEIDFLNCKIIYENLSFLNESQASEEMLWAGLTHTVFYEYMRKRWGYGYGKKPLTADKEKGEIQTRFFYKGGSRAGFYRNSISKCWWVGHNTYNPSADNKFEMLDIIGSNDINSKITELFYNFTFSSNYSVMEGIVDALNELNKEGIKLSVREHLRPAMSHLNAVGGNSVIDCMTREEICDIFLNDIYSIIQGDETALSIEDDDDELNEAEQDDATTETIANVVSDIRVVLGCIVKIRNAKGEEKTCKYDAINGIIPFTVRCFNDCSIGDKVEFMEEEWEIIDISF